MTRVWAVFLGVTCMLTCALAPAIASAQRRRVRVTVTDVAGERAYVTPGRGRGIEPGTRVVIGRRNYTVEASTESYAIVEIGDRQISIGTRGVARIRRRRGREETVEPLPPVRPLSELRGQWGPAVLASGCMGNPDDIAFYEAQGDSPEYDEVGGHESAVREDDPLLCGPLSSATNPDNPDDDYLPPQGRPHDENNLFERVIEYNYCEVVVNEYEEFECHGIYGTELQRRGMGINAQWQTARVLTTLPCAVP